MFKKGDIVRATKRRYVYTSYMRPCLVKGYDSSGKLLIEPFDDGSTYDVDDTEFEIIPPNEIFKTGQMIRIKELDRLVEFKKYKDRGYIEVVDNGRLSEYFIDDIIFEEGFYI